MHKVIFKKVNLTWGPDYPNEHLAPNTKEVSIISVDGNRIEGVFFNTEDIEAVLRALPVEIVKI